MGLAARVKLVPFPNVGSEPSRSRLGAKRDFDRTISGHSERKMATTDYSISTLPANVEAERSILGAILLDNFAYNQAAEHLRIEDFSLDSTRRIYGRMVDLAESSRPIDMITLIEELDRHKDLQP